MIERRLSLGELSLERSEFGENCEMERILS